MEATEYREGGGSPPRRETLSWAAAVVVIAVVALGWWLVVEKGVFKQKVMTEEIAPGQIVSRPVAEGEVIASFPKEFLVEPGVEGAESYEISYTDSGTVFPAVRYTSSLSLAENVSLFESALRAGGFEIVQTADAAAEGVTFFYGKRGREEVNITFIPREGELEVSVAYLIQGEAVE